MPLTETTKRLTLTEQVFSQLRELVLTNQLQVGGYFLEQELAQMLGSSRTPLREAVIRLEQEGLVTIVPRRGVYIRPVSADEMHDIYEVLSWLEAAAIAAACTRDVAESTLTELELTYTAMQEVLQSGDLEVWAINDKRFHQILAELSNNNELIRLFNSYWDKTDRVRMMTLRIRKPTKQSTEDHRRLIEALRTGNSETAVAMNREHRARAVDELTTLLSVLGNNSAS